jgi:hypothetical protein
VGSRQVREQLPILDLNIWSFDSSSPEWVARSVGTIRLAGWEAERPPFAVCDLDYVLGLGQLTTSRLTPVRLDFNQGFKRSSISERMRP